MAPSPTDPRPRRVLVVVASRHGATREIAGAVAGVRAAGLDVHVEDAGIADELGRGARVGAAR